MPDATASLLIDTRSELGEGPIWTSGGLLLWVDIEGGLVHSWEPATEVKREWAMGEMVGAVLPTQGTEYIVALESGLALFDPQTGSTLLLGVLENSDPQMRFNDGKCDPQGNLWIGTMNKNAREPVGELYKVGPDLKSISMIRNTTVSNGMAWSADQKYFYYIDSATYELRVFEYDKKRALISRGRSLYTIPRDFGAADGMAIDSEGMLWIAHWGGHAVRRWDPASGNVLQTIKVPAPHVTSCCFGGADLSTLFITTARSGLSDKQLEEYPMSGSVFVYQTQTSGKPADVFKLEKPIEWQRNTSGKK